MPKPYTYKDLPITPARIRKHLEFCVAYREQETRDLAANAEGFAATSRYKRRQHQQSLAEIRAAR